MQAMNTLFRVSESAGPGAIDRFAPELLLLCNESILGGFVKVTNLPYLEGFCYVTKPSTWRVGVT